MDTPRPTNLARRLESARSATELTTSVLSAAVQLVTFVALVRRALRAIGKGTAPSRWSSAATADTESDTDTDLVHSN